MGQNDASAPCRFELVDRARDAHGTKADWYCVTHNVRADSPKGCAQRRREFEGIDAAAMGDFSIMDAMMGDDPA